MQTLLKTTRAYQLLQAEAQDGQLSHAYLLTFQDARNLRTALKTFAKLFFGCLDDTNLTAKQQRISNLIDAENFSDCLFFPADGKKLTVEDAEKIQEESVLNPVETEKKLFILSDFAEANTQTQNKLLKLLEEPPQGVTFLLGATTVFPVLQTVLSRTKKLEILPFDVTDVTRCLQRIYGDKYDGDVLSVCAAASGGNVGEAQNILEGGQYKTLVDNAFSLVLCSPEKLPALTRQVGETKHPKELLALLRLIYRDALLLHLPKNNQKNILLSSELTNLKKVAQSYQPSALIYAQDALSQAEKQVQFNAVFPQCIQLCIAKILEKNKQ
ncbi:MAG: hypothetical protein IJX87_05100 [Clostridia bacterium]|nr:hypothetical protein [Clostridia bacterium]